MNNTLPTFFVSHGGGPWTHMDEMKAPYAKTIEAFSQLQHRLPAKPKAILVISGHWEAPGFTVSTSEHPPMEYDYSGFPTHTYRIQYPAPGSPRVAARVRELLSAAGISSQDDAKKGFDHGTFIPLGLIFPEADVPVVTLSMKSSYDPSEHIRVGQALAPLRDEGVLIIGSGLSYHNMRGFCTAGAMAVSEAFEAYLNDAITDPDATQRLQKLANWTSTPSARAAHPQEDHLIPLMVVAGAAGEDAGRRLLVDKVMNVAMASYQFGTTPAPLVK